MEQKFITETLQYLATGLLEWENLEPSQRSQIPKALRIGMSRMYAASSLQGERAPANIKEFFEKVTQPIKSWWSPAAVIEALPDEAVLIDDGLVSDLARDWVLSGKNPIAQVQEFVLAEVKQYCTPNLEDAYRSFRQLIITTPVLRRIELEDYLDSSTLRPLKDYFKRTYKPLIALAEYEEYHLCSRCKYFQRLRSDGSYSCRNAFCEQLRVNHSDEFPTLPSISRREADQWLAVTYGVYLYGTIPGIWEVKLAQDITNLGDKVKVTLWPHVDWYDLLVELPGNIKWAIDVKDWSFLTSERLKDVRIQPEATETFVVFPDAREELRIPVIRKQKQYSKSALGGLQLKLSSEIVKAAKKVLKNA